MKLPTLKRFDCGECTACCTAIGVADLGKPYYVPCANLNGRCGCYDQRPQGCRDFECAWSAGLMGDAVTRRPDRIGWIFLFGYESGTLTLDVYEAREGINDVDAERLPFLINKLAEKMPFEVVRYYYWRNRVGVGYPILPPYEPGTQNIGNRYVRDDAQPEVIYHVNPDSPWLRRAAAEAAR